MQTFKLFFTALLILFIAGNATAQIPCPEAGKPLPVDKKQAVATMVKK